MTFIDKNCNLHNNCHHNQSSFLSSSLQSYAGGEAASGAVAKPDSTGIGEVCNQPERAHLGDHFHDHDGVHDHGHDDLF